MCSKGYATCSWPASRWLAGATSWSALDAPGSTGRTASRTWSTSLYGAFPPAEAKRLADKLELHSTPRHGSWLNMAEIELAMLTQQCLDRRLADRATLEREAAAWQAARNRAGRGVNWRFTTEDARIKLRHLYPTTQG
jgi:hypothetical protein